MNANETTNTTTETLETLYYLALINGEQLNLSRLDDPSMSREDLHSRLSAVTRYVHEMRELSNAIDSMMDAFTRETIVEEIIELTEADFLGVIDEHACQFGAYQDKYASSFESTNAY